MQELISHPGLKFYIRRLCGTLTYTLSIANKPPKYFELSDADFEDVSSEGEMEGVSHVHGKEASAVGLELNLIKNDGFLEVQFEGTNGGKANWKFLGLQEQGKMLAMAGVQTDERRMKVTGSQTMMTTTGNAVCQTSLRTMTHAGMQTMVNTTKATGVQTGSTAVVNAQVQTRLSFKDLERAFRKEKLSDSDSLSNTQRVAPRTQQEDQWNDPWPRHLFMEGRRNSHKKIYRDSSDQGILHIDRKTAKLRWRETSYISDNWDRKRSMKEVIDLNYKALDVTMVRQIGPEGSDKPDHWYIKLWYPGKNGQQSIRTSFGYFQGSLRLWANNDKGPITARSKFDDVQVIVEEIKRCIDSATGRPCSVLHSKTKIPFNLEDWNTLKRKAAHSFDQLGGQRRKRRRIDGRTEEEWTEPWPRHLFLKGHKLGFSNTAGYGQLHIDRKTHKLSFWGLCCDGRNKRAIKEAIKLKKRRTKVQYEVGDNSSLLRIWYPEFSKDGISEMVLLAFQITNKLEMWGNNDLKNNSNLLISDIKILLEELVICIDKSSGWTSSIPNPRTKGPYSSARDIPGDPLPRAVLMLPSDQLSQSHPPSKPSNQPTAKPAPETAVITSTFAKAAQIETALQFLQININDDPILKDLRDQLRLKKKKRRPTKIRQIEIHYLALEKEERKKKLREDLERIATAGVYWRKGFSGFEGSGFVVSVPEGQTSRRLVNKQEGDEL